MAATTSATFCGDRDSPKFTVEEAKDGYEVRKYESSKWVGAVVSSMHRSDALSIGYKKLRSYWNGENKQGLKMKMTLPVATKIVPSQGPACESTFTVLFFVPFENQASIPEPLSSEIVKVDFPAITAYVAPFEGAGDDDSLQSSALKLGDALMKDKLNFVQDYYFTADYDPQSVKTDHQNEVWFLAA